LKLCSGQSQLIHQILIPYLRLKIAEFAIQLRKRIGESSSVRSPVLSETRDLILEALDLNFARFFVKLRICLCVPAGDARCVGVKDSEHGK
jgi:hypothetical protein